MTSEQAKAQGFDPIESCAYFYANGMARILRTPDGFVKLVADSATKKILGFHMVGPYAEEILGTGVTMVASGLSAKSLSMRYFPIQQLGRQLWRRWKDYDIFGKFMA